MAEFLAPLPINRRTGRADVPSSASSLSSLSASSLFERGSRSSVSLSESSLAMKGPTKEETKTDQIIDSILKDNQPRLAVEGENKVVTKESHDALRPVIEKTKKPLGRFVLERLNRIFNPPSVPVIFIPACDNRPYVFKEAATEAFQINPVDVTPSTPMPVLTILTSSQADLAATTVSAEPTELSVSLESTAPSYDSAANSPAISIERLVMANEDSVNTVPVVDPFLAQPSTPRLFAVAGMDSPSSIDSLPSPKMTHLWRLEPPTCSPWSPVFEPREPDISFDKPISDLFPSFEYRPHLTVTEQTCEQMTTSTSFDFTDDFISEPLMSDAMYTMYMAAGDSIPLAATETTVQDNSLSMDFSSDISLDHVRDPGSAFVFGSLRNVTGPNLFELVESPFTAPGSASSSVSSVTSLCAVDSGSPFGSPTAPQCEAFEIPSTLLNSPVQPSPLTFSSLEVSKNVILDDGQPLAPMVSASPCGSQGMFQRENIVYFSPSALASPAVPPILSDGTVYFPPIYSSASRDVQPPALFKHDLARFAGEICNVYPAYSEDNIAGEPCLERAVSDGIEEVSIAPKIACEPRLNQTIFDEIQEVPRTPKIPYVPMLCVPTFVPAPEPDLDPPKTAARDAVAAKPQKKSSSRRGFLRKILSFLKL